MRRAALAAIERKLFIHDPNRQRLANRKLMGATNRLPEHPQVTPGQSSRSGGNEIVKIHRRLHNSLSRARLSSERATEPLGSGRVRGRTTLCFKLRQSRFNVSRTHPNAAVVFINWLLSKEGQLVWSKAVNAVSRRV